MTKSILLSTTALAVTGMTSMANAAEWSAEGPLSLDIGGYFTTLIGIASVNSPVGSDYDGVDVYTDAEIHFMPSIMLDNGITFGAHIELEGNTDGDQIDESYAFVKGSFGEALLGSENSAGYKMSYGAPDVSLIGVNSGSLTAFIPYSGTAGGVNTGDDIFRGTLGTTYLENAGNNDAQRMTYFSPRFSGFQLGVSYARDPSQVNGATNNLTNIHDIFDIGANYTNSFGDIDVAASARWGIASDPVNSMNPEVWGFGLNLGHGGFTIGGSFAEQNDTLMSDGKAFDLGVGYDNGPWGYSFTYFNGENIDDENAVVGGKENMEQYMLATKYQVNPNFALSVFGAYVDFEEDLDDTGAATGADDVDGFVIGTGVKFSF